MSRNNLLLILLPAVALNSFPVINQPVAAACQPIARIASPGASRPKGAAVCAHERIALNSGTTSVKVTCLTNQKQIDFKGGSAFMACATQKSAQLMRCPTDRQIICIEPKTSAIRFRAIQTATHLVWSSIPNATHYKITLSGHGVQWQGDSSQPSMDYQNIAGLLPGNAYQVIVEAYQGETSLTIKYLALNIPPDPKASSPAK